MRNVKVDLKFLEQFENQERMRNNGPKNKVYKLEAEGRPSQGFMRRIVKSVNYVKKAQSMTDQV